MMVNPSTISVNNLGNLAIVLRTLVSVPNADFNALLVLVSGPPNTVGLGNTFNAGDWEARPKNGGSANNRVGGGGIGAP